MPLLEDFASLFRGRDDVWGSVEGKSNKEKVTDEHYKLHLEGKRSLGIYPLLDDGNCYFFAVDIDDNDFNKARAIRDKLYGFRIPVYIAQSKSKGYHVYGFCKEGVPAADIRWVLFSIMEELKFLAEIFPKQDKLDEVTRYGNYINLPCFGNTRLFQTRDEKAIPTADAIKRIKTVSPAKVSEAKAAFPPPPAPYATQLVPKVKKIKGLTHPPCIEYILKGVTQGCRDEAAFALARHYLDQGYLPEETFGLLLAWDAKNRPPVGDMRILQAKVQSAQKGYAFGCASITGEPLLSQFCPGKEKCTWLTDQIREKKKKGLITERTFYETEGFLYEEVIEHSKSLEQVKPAFCAYNKETGEMTLVDQIEEAGVTILPANGDEIFYSSIILPAGVEPYGSLEKLMNDLREHIRKYLDIRPSALEQCILYILMSWTYENLFTVPFLRFQGDTGVGKSRALDVIGRLCYKPILVAGAITPAPMYRIMRKYAGTIILDEADFPDSTEAAEIVKILNCSYESGRPIMRCLKDDPNTIETMPIYGPKVLATRDSFRDKALESRCFSFTMRATRRKDIPPILGKAFRLAQIELRKKLLAYRLTNFLKFNWDIELETIAADWEVEPRLKQVGIPMIVALRKDPETVDKFKTWLKEHSQDLISGREETYEGSVVKCIFVTAQQVGKHYITAAAISKVLADEEGLELSANKVGRYLKRLGISKVKRRAGMKITSFIVWDNDDMKTLAERYLSDASDFAELFEKDEQFFEGSEAK